MLFNKIKEVVLEELDRNTKYIRAYINEKNLNIDFIFEAPFQNSVKVNMTISYNGKSFLFEEGRPYFDQEVELISKLEEDEKGVVLATLKAFSSINQKLASMF